VVPAAADAVSGAVRTMVCVWTPEVGPERRQPAS
jgi:hypothetical protein